MRPIPSLGVDIAQPKFVAALWFEARRFLKQEFANSPAGFRRLERWLRQHFVGPLRLGIESTNVYGEALAEWMHRKGHTVYLLNPERTACYARCRGQRNKTDPADAVTIAAFVATHADLTRWHPLPAEQKDLRSLTRARHQLVALHTQLRNQLKTASGLGRTHLAAAAQALADELINLGRQIAAHLRAFASLGEQVRRLMTVKGIGLITAATAIAELPTITADTDTRAICSWVGLTPRRRQSGRTELPTRLSRHGNAYLRDALFMPALVAKRWNPLLRDFAQRLRDRGKSPNAILGAVAHKLLRILVGLLRSNRDFDPNWSTPKI
jgi:transposase